MEIRAQLTKENLEVFWDEIKAKMDISWKEIAAHCKVTARTLNDWRRGKYYIPVDKLSMLSELAEVKFPKIEKTVDKYWYTHLGANLGWKKVFEKYGGNIGTTESRKLGAMRAMETHRKNKTGFFVCKDVKLPGPSAELAEFFGILLGDGSLGHRQVSITLHRFDDKDFISYVAGLCSFLFGVQPAVLYHKNTVVSNIVISRTRLIAFLQQRGLLVGNKVKQQVGVPSWISEDSIFSRHCLRGLFDTDGCFYIDKHRYKDKIYYNCGMNFTNRSLPLLNFFKHRLEQHGFNPTQRTKYSVFLRKEKEIIRYFQEIGSSNPKHVNKFRGYLENKFGEVPKRS